MVSKTKREFDWFRKEIETREAQIKHTQEIMLGSEHVSDYWWYLNRLEKLKQEKWVLEEMAKEKGIYIV